MELIQGRTFPPYLKTVRKLKKKYPNIEADLEKLFSEIAKDPERALKPVIVPGTDGAGRMYRCASRDQQKGSQGGFRVLCLYFSRSGVATIWPLLVYAKAAQPNRPSAKTIEALVSQLKEHLAEDFSSHERRE